MEKMQKRIQGLGGAALLLFAQQGAAAIIDGIIVPAGQTVTINVKDTMKAKDRNDPNNPPPPMNNVVVGTLNNFGLLKTDYDMFVNGVLNNHGVIFPEQAFSIQGGDIGKIVNHADGLIVMTGYIDMYHMQSDFENAGRLIVAKSIGDQGLGASDYLLPPSGKSYMPFTYVFRGTIKNTGSMLIDRNNGLNVCQLGHRSIGVFFNEGVFEIADGSLCHFAEYPADAFTKATYIQNAGETKLNGSFSAHQVNINKGLLSGNGNLAGNISALFSPVTIAPGAPVGTLNITPDKGQLICSSCSIAIELSSATSADQLHVEGKFYMSNWKLNVQLRDGYIPAPGTSFTVVSASNYIQNSLLEPIYNLPTLPNDRTWSVQNTGSEIVLTAN